MVVFGCNGVNGASTKSACFVSQPGTNLACLLSMGKCKKVLAAQMASRCKKFVESDGVKMRWICRLSKLLEERSAVDGVKGAKSSGGGMHSSNGSSEQARGEND